MMEYSLLIVDDEEIIRKGLIARLEYLQIYPGSIYEASDGQEALQIIIDKKPEIIITDIRMPDMDGLELIRRTRDMQIAAEFVILSGHAEFSYAEQAIQTGVNAYLLKPLSDVELSNVLAGVCAKLDESKKMQNVILEKGRMSKKAQDLDIEKKLNEILHNQETDNRTERPGGAKKYVTVIINIDGSTYETNHFNYRDLELIKFAIINIFNELKFSGEKHVVNNLSNRNQLIAVINWDKEKDLRQETEYFFTKLVHIAGQSMSISLTVGVSSIRDEISTESYKEANDAFLQRMVSGIGDVYFYENMQALSKQSFPKAELEMLSRYIERGDVGNIEIILMDIFSKERMQQSVTDYIRVIWIRIINSLLKASNQRFEEGNSQLDKSVLNFDVIDHFNDVEELIQYIYTLIIDFIQPGCISDMKSRNKIKLAVKYIEDNYFLDFSITDLAYEYAMSPNYFSTSFKEETGMTIVNYTKKLRMEKACELLEKTGQSVAEISQAVGYSDSQYFFRVFKKEMGITPLQYRNANRFVR